MTRAFTDAELQAAKLAVARMSVPEFRRAAQAIGLLYIQKAAAKPRRQRTAIVRVVAYGNSFGAECGWCGWTTRQARTFHFAQLAAHNHNRHAHRDHCVVEARVA